MSLFLKLPEEKIEKGYVSYGHYGYLTGTIGRKLRQKTRTLLVEVQMLKVSEFSRWRVRRTSHNYQTPFDNK